MEKVRQLKLVEGEVDASVESGRGVMSIGKECVHLF